MCDRAFDSRRLRCSQPGRQEPHIALCGVDNREGRRHFGHADFLCVLECGLGGFAADFDEIGFHSFPNANTEPAKLWQGEATAEASRARQKILEPAAGPCGASSCLRSLFLRASSAQSQPASSWLNSFGCITMEGSVRTVNSLCAHRSSRNSSSKRNVTIH